MVKQLILVGLGGGIGSILRYLTSLATRPFNSRSFPVATFTANIVGCLLIGVFLAMFGQNTPSQQNLKLLFITGFCGGYTTFSAFAAENMSLIQNQQFGVAVGYTVASMAGGLLAVGLGYVLVRQG